MIFKGLNVNLLVAKRSKVAMQENDLVPVAVPPKEGMKSEVNKLETHFEADDPGVQFTKTLFPCCLVNYH